MNVLTVLAEITVYASIIAVAVMIVKKLFATQMSARLHYAIWLLLFVRLMLPFTVDSGFHFYTAPVSQVRSEQIETVQQRNGDAFSVSDNASGANISNAISHQNRTAVNTTQISSSAFENSGIVLNTSDVLLIIWIGGMIVSLVYIMTVYLLTVRKIKRGILNPARKLYDMLEQEKSQLGIERSITLKTIYGLHTPALFFPSTILIPMECMESMTDDELRLSVRHELTHYKRKDHWFGLILVLLQGVYWFHPVVWLAFRQIRKDMETACDADVVKTMGNNEKRVYANTILSCIGNKKSLAMIGLSVNTKKNMQQRIQGIFNNARTNRQGRIAAVTLAALLLVSCFTTACQPTPTQPVVVNKNDDALEKVIEASPAPTQKYEAPAHWNEEYFEKELSISVDADLKLPEVDAYPIYKVEPRYFTKEQVQILSDALFGDAEVMGVNQRWTKSQYEELIVHFKQSHQQGNSGKSDKEFEEDLTDLEQRWQDAPEAVEPFNMQEAMALFDETGRITLQADMGRKEPAELTAINDEKFGPHMGFSNNDGLGYEEHLVQDTTGLQLSLPDAIQQAQDLLAELGIDYMDVAYTDIGVAYGREGENTDNHPRCYLIYFTRTVDGIPTTYDWRTGAASDNDDYDIVWSYERIIVGVDDSGIVQFVWAGNAVLAEKMTENAQLIPFEDVKERFIQGMKNTYIYPEDPSALEHSATNSTHFDVDRVVLGMSRIKLKDNGGYSLVPVWDFFGKETTEWINADGEPGTTVTDESSRSFLTINALDGTIINRTFGY